MYQVTPNCDFFAVGTALYTTQPIKLSTGFGRSVAVTIVEVHQTALVSTCDEINNFHSINSVTFLQILCSCLYHLKVFLEFLMLKL